MSGQLSKPSPLNELCSALPSLPMRLQQVGRFVAANDYDATTRSMRELAVVAGADPPPLSPPFHDSRYFWFGATPAAPAPGRPPRRNSPRSSRGPNRRRRDRTPISHASL